MTQKIDFVIPWVDGADPEWCKAKNEYQANTIGDARDNRYRDWCNLKYWFRSVERFTPWVNKIFFVTWGHIPDWLKTEHEKLCIVKHEDYIPKDYLPTFSANPIELNFHRIEGLSEQFVYFNDDMFVLKPMNPNDFFKNGLPRDSAIIRPRLNRFRNSIGCIVSNNMEIVNTSFDKNIVIKKNFIKWFHPCYKRNLIHNMYFLPYKYFPGFVDQHIPYAFLKRTYELLWQIEYEILHETCTHKFRDKRDVNQWLFRYWQILEGEFIPRSLTIGKYYSIADENSLLLRDIREQRCKLICLNDDYNTPITKFEKVRDDIVSAFESILPQKSSFEK
jgi:hypothetical protein